MSWLGLSEGTTYQWYAIADDGTDSTQSATCSFTVLEDTPIWVVDPTDQTIDYGDDFSYNVNATDASGIAYYQINNTSFNIDSNGVITNVSTLSVGVYWINVGASDPYNNYCNATFKITVEDSTPPTWDETPTNQFVEISRIFAYNLNASDYSGIDDYWINDTTNFNIDGNGIITNITVLMVGDYWVAVGASDPYDNYCNATFKITFYEYGYTVIVPPGDGEGGGETTSAPELDITLIIILLIIIVVGALLGGGIVYNARRKPKSPKLAKEARAKERVKREILKIKTIKKTVLESGQKFARIQLTELCEKSKIEDRDLIVRTIREMIDKKEIDAEYFESTESLAFNIQPVTEDIDKLMKGYDKLEKNDTGKK